MRIDKENIKKYTTMILITGDMLKMFNKQKAKKEMLKQGINTDDDANKFMDGIVNKLDDSQLHRAYLGAKKKYDRKPNSSSEYVLIYLIKKCNEKGIKL